MHFQQIPSPEKHSAHASFKKSNPIECSPLPCVFVPPAVYTDFEFSRLLQTAVGDGALVKPKLYIYRVTHCINAHSDPKKHYNAYKISADFFINQYLLY